MSAGRGYTAGMKPLALVPFVVLALAGCGNKGPLVHPDTRKPAPPQPSSTQPAPASATPETH